MNKCESVFIKNYGTPDVLKLEETTISEPTPNEVQVEVSFSGINFADIMSRMGLYTTRLKPPYSLGMEIAGKVKNAGSNRLEKYVGKTVVGLCKSGGYSTRVNVPFEQLFIIDEKWLNVSAAIPVNYLTAYFMMFHQGSIRKDETILIHGAGGGVGVAALQLAKYAGANIIGTASKGKHQKLKELGLHHIIDYQNRDFYEECNDITNGRGVDLVLDSLGGFELNKSYKILSEFGRVGIYGFSTAVTGPKRNYLKILPKFLGTPKFKPTHLMMKNQGVFGFHLGMIKSRKDLVRRYGENIFNLLEKGEINPVIDSVFDLEKASEAHWHIANRKNFGKVLLACNK